MSEELLFTKIVDQSVLFSGISIPVSVRGTLNKHLESPLLKGEQRSIVIEIGSYRFDAVLKNQSFDDKKYQNHSDIVQIRYTTQSLLAKRIREEFSSTTSLVNEHLAVRENKRTQLVIPREKREYIAIYIEGQKLRFDCISRHTERTVTAGNDLGEEAPQRRETVSSTFKRNAIVIEKARQRAKGVCQLCGQPAPFKDKQGEPYLEVHHVIWLSKGGADKLSNAVALCPNCHSKMHIVDDEKDVKLLLEIMSE